jgi:cytochrome P450
MENLAKKECCSFCGRDRDQLAALVADPEAYICGTCVEVASAALKGKQYLPKYDPKTMPPAVKVGLARGAFILLGGRFGGGGRAAMESWQRRAGDAFTIIAPIVPMQIVFSHPAAIEEIFSSDELQTTAARDLIPILGENSLIVMNGPRHKRDRRLMQPPFHGNRMRSYLDRIRAITNDAIDRWPIGRPFRIHRETRSITLEVILSVVFGLDDSDQVSALRRKISEFAMKLPAPIFMLDLLQRNLGPLTPWSRFVRRREELQAMLSAEIAGKLSRTTPGDDILSMLIEARSEDGGRLSAEELRDEMMTLLLAGHETTASALAWATWEILSHPEVLARIKDELRSVTNGGAADRDKLEQLKYLDAALKESLRLNPIIGEVARRTDRPVKIAGYELPPGVIIHPSIYLTHRRADIYPEPTKFAPERFMERRPGPFEFLPFGGGERRCIGMAFALYEMKAVMAEIISRVDLRLADRHKPRGVSHSITDVPAGGVRVIAQSRSPRA